MRYVISKSLAANIEQCIKHVHMNVTSQYVEGKILAINGGAACFSGKDSYLSQVIGWGFNSTIAEAKTELKLIEDFYRQQSHTCVDIELCPYVDNDLIITLNQRNYRISELNNVSILNLTNYTHEELCSSFIIKEIDASELKNWALRIAQGFDNSNAQNQFYRYAGTPGVKVFAAYENNVIVAGAVIATCESNSFCDLGLASTLPAYRKRGLQKALLHARLKCAKTLGMKWAVVTTLPGSISDANVQKIGFRLAYTRFKMTRRLI